MEVSNMVDGISQLVLIFITYWIISDKCCDKDKSWKCIDGYI